MKKILLTSVASLAIAGVANNAMATWGTEGHVDLNGAKEAIERVDNSWAAMNGLRDLFQTAAEQGKTADETLGLVGQYLAKENTTSAYEDETTNIGVISGIITDTAKIQEGFYTTLASLTDEEEGAIALEAKARAAEDLRLNSAIDANRNNFNALDSKVNELDENLSAGIASSVALSSVAVANVQRGEVSVGGGYGNYNSKSAMAFGAAMGITDNWSANAGVGLGFGTGTKASFRVGTNYKFKLF